MNAGFLRGRERAAYRGQRALDQTLGPREADAAHGRCVEATFKKRADVLGIVSLLDGGDVGQGRGLEGEVAVDFEEAAEETIFFYGETMTGREREPIVIGVEKTRRGHGLVRIRHVH